MLQKVPAAVHIQQFDFTKLSDADLFTDLFNTICALAA